MYIPTTMNLVPEPIEPVPEPEPVPIESVTEPEPVPTPVPRKRKDRPAAQAFVRSKRVFHPAVYAIEVNNEKSVLSHFSDPKNRYTKDARVRLEATCDRGYKSIDSITIFHTSTASIVIESVSETVEEDTMYIRDNVAEVDVVFKRQKPKMLWCPVEVQVPLIMLHRNDPHIV